MNGLRVVFITTSDSGVLRALLASKHRLVGLVESGPRRRKQGGVEPSAAYRLARAVYRKLRRNKRGPSLGDLAADRGIAHFLLNEQSEPALEGWVRERSPDVIAIFGMSRLLKESVFSIPALGAINLHPALLPQHRGPNPFFWMYHDMDREGGATVLFVDAGEDTGDIIYQEKFPIHVGMTMIEMQKRAMEIGVRLLLQALDALAAGSFPRQPQRVTSVPARARFLRPEDDRQLIQWESWPIERVWHLLHGTQGWWAPIEPAKGWRRYSKWTVGSYSKENVTGVPGTVGRDSGGHYVVHPEGKIHVARQLDVKRLVKRLLGRPAPTRSSGS